MTRADDSPTLIFETTEGSLARTSIDGDGITLGRDGSCDVQIDHPTVSRRHARILREGVDGWRYEDLASRNGTRASGIAPGGVDLTNGAALRLGRVRAWFFRTAPPADWTPDDEPPASQGKLVRCRCGHVGWAPDYTSGLTVRCKACRGEIVVGDDREFTRSVPTVTVANCPGCRTLIADADADADAAHLCVECGVQMHAECHRELGGCATYGCSRVNELRGETPPTAEESTDALEMPIVRVSSLRRDRWPIVTWTLVGLVTFGVPAFIWAIAALAKKGRPRGALIAIVGGAIGAATSFVGWSLALNDGVWPW